MRRFPGRPRLVRHLGLSLVVALGCSFLPLLNFEWVPTAVLDQITPHFEPAGAEEPPTTEHDHVDATSADDDATAEDGRAVAVEAVEPFTAIAARFDADPAAPVYVRAREAGGSWSEWIHLEVGSDHAGDGVAARPSSEPVFVDQADAYELNVPAAATEGAEVVLIRDVMTRALVDAAPLADAAVTPPPVPVHTRAEWGARAARSTTYGPTVKLTVVHHSVTTNSYSAGAGAAAQLRSIQAYHMDGRGWSDIGYNFAVDRYGSVWEARGGGIDRPVVGAHAAGFNTNSVGIVVLGDYSATGISSTVRESIARLAGWKMFLHGTDPAGSVAFTAGTGSVRYAPGSTVVLPGVVGHRDVGSTSCPGSIHASLPWLRTRAQEWTNWLRATSVPFGNLELIAALPGAVVARGWAVDPDAGGPSPVRLTAGGLSATATADQPRPDVAQAYPQTGPDHGFTVGLSGVPPGYQQACVTVVDLNAGLGDVSLGCRWVYVPDPSGHSPTGSIDALRAGTGTMSLSGRATDPDAPGTSVQVAVEVDGRVLARRTTDTVGAFGASFVGVAGGPRRVCMVVTNVGEGATLRADCRTVTVGGSPPIGRLEWVGTDPRRQVGLFGWVYDPETTGAVRVRIRVGGRRVDVMADQPRDGLPVPAAYGADRGFSAVVAATPGRHEVCAWAVDVPTGAERLLGCRTVVVK